MNFIRNILKWNVARFADSFGARFQRQDGSILSLPSVVSYPDFTPSILASFVAGATASQSGTTVTVSATAHGIVGNSTHDGYRIYYPGSPSIPAGWYSGFTWVNANTVSFQRPPATVVSESVNGGAAFASMFVVVCSATVPGGALGPRGSVEAKITRGGDTASGIKYVRHLVGGNNTSAATATTMPNGSCSMTVSNQSDSVQVYSGGVDGAVSSVKQFLSVNTALDFVDSITLGVTNAAQWVSLDAAELRIVKR